MERRSWYFPKGCSQENVINFLSLELLLNSMDQQRLLNAQSARVTKCWGESPSSRPVWGLQFLDYEQLSRSDAIQTFQRLSALNCILTRSRAMASESEGTKVQPRDIDRCWAGSLMAQNPFRIPFCHLDASGVLSLDSITVLYTRSFHCHHCTSWWCRFRIQIVRMWQFLLILLGLSQQVPNKMKSDLQTKSSYLPE